MLSQQRQAARVTIRCRPIVGIREDLQGEVMVSHHEFIARQRVERFLQLLRLRDRKVAGIPHPMKLTLQQRLARRLGQKRKRLGEHERKSRGQKPIEHPHRRGSRILLDTEQRADPGFRRRPIFDRLVAEHQAAGGQPLGERSARHRDLLPLAVEKNAEKLENGRAPEITGTVGSQDQRLVSGERGLQRLRQLGTCLQRIRQLHSRALALRPGNDSRERVRRDSRCGAIHHAEIDLVDHQRLVRQPVVVAIGERFREFARTTQVQAGTLTAADDMRPQRHPRVGEIPPERIEPLMPDIELDVIGALEAHSREAKYLQVVAEYGLDHALGYVSAVRDAFGHRMLSMQSRSPLCVQHAGFSRRRPTTAVRLAPRPSGRSKDRGL